MSFGTVTAMVGIRIALAENLDYSPLISLVRNGDVKEKSNNQYESYSCQANSRKETQS